MKKVRVILVAIVLTFGATVSNVQFASAQCNDGHSSTGNQGFGGPKGRWELVCDRVTSSICCVSHPNPQQ